VNKLSNRPLVGNKNGQAKLTGSFKSRGGITVVKWLVVVIAIAVLGAGLAYYQSRVGSAGHGPTQAPPQVVVSRPLKKELDTQLGFLGQFSAVDQVELRAQVGGTLTEIHFKDGDIVHKGDLLFVIDPVPYESNSHKLPLSSKARLRVWSLRLVNWIAPVS